TNARTAGSAFDADDGAQRVHDVDEVALGFDDAVDVLVRGGRLVQDVLVLAAFDPRRRGGMVVERDALARLVARHAAPRTVRAALERVGVPLAANDVRARAHRAGDDAELALTRAHGALPRHQHVFAEVLLPRDVVVVAVHRRLRIHRERLRYRALDGADDGVEHQPAIRLRELLCPADRL